MNSIYILHGYCDREEYHSQDYPSPSNNHWIPWLQRQLLIKGYNCQTPELPHNTWKQFFDVFPVDTETILVAHSCGGGFFLRWLSENKHAVKKLVLVAPWLDPNAIYRDFLEFTLSQFQTF